LRTGLAQSGLYIVHEFYIANDKFGAGAHFVFQGNRPFIREAVDLIEFARMLYDPAGSQRLTAGPAKPQIHKIRRALRTSSVSPLEPCFAAA
jgi:hypothetical protein